jgi:four helix bundle protein
METKFKFEDLIIWQKAMVIGEALNELVKRFPDKEKFNLSSKVLRAADSIEINISEGSIEQSPKEFKKYMGYSVRSLAEVVTCLHKANYRKYITPEEFNEQYSFAYILMNMMIAFKKSIK